MTEPILSALGEDGRFLLRRRLGAGGFGVVYEAYDQRYTAPVALKILHETSPSSLYRFKREFRVLADVVHPNLVTLYELVAEQESWFFTMELVEGAHFLDYLRRDAPPARGLWDDETFSGEASAARGAPTTGITEPSNASGVARTFDGLDPEDLLNPQVSPVAAASVGSLPPEDRLRHAFLQLAHAVRALHDARVLHRDLKPSNVRVTAAGRVVVLDFGLVEELAPARRRRPGESLIGTPMYMAPEIWLGAPESEASDWYSVGVMLYEALAGRAPFSPRSWPPARGETPLPPSSLREGIPTDLDELCQELLRDDPAARPDGASILRRLGDGPAAPRGSISVASLRSAPLVGRERETEALMAAYEDAARGSAVVVHVHGASGMGKSALVNRFLDQIRSRGAVILTGRCYERESVPYKAFDGLMDELAHHVGALPDASARALIPEGGRDLARLFPVLASALRTPREAPGEVEPREARRRAFGALKEILARIAAERPLVLCIDDLHWGDVDSARLLAEILSPPGAPPLLLLASYRSDEADHSAFFAEIWRLSRANGIEVDTREILVGPLSHERALTMARTALGDEGSSEGLAEIIARESGGSPFFIEEMVLHSTDAGDFGAVAADGAPIALDRVLRSRLDRLDAPARRLLEIDAVAGGPLEQSIAIEAAELGEAALPSLATLRAARLVRARPVRDHTSLEPFHDRIREATLAGLDRATRARHHRRLATILAASASPDPELLAMHYHGAGELSLAARHAAVAADRASDALAFERAAELYGRAIAWIRGGSGDTPAERRRLTILRAHAFAHAGRGAEAAKLYLEATATGPLGEELDLRRRAAEQYLVSGHIDEGIRVLGPVLREVELDYPPTIPRAVALAVLLYARLTLRGQRFEEQREDRIPAAVLARVDVCGGIGRALTDVDPLRATCFQLRHLLLALDAGEPARVAVGLGTFGAMLTAQGTPSAVQKGTALVEQGAAIARRIGAPHLLGYASIQSGFCDIVAGDFSLALGRFDDALRRLQGERGVAWERNLARAGAFIALEALGKIRELGIRSAVWRREAIEMGDLFGRISASMCLGLSMIAADDADGARRLVREALIPWSQRGFHVQHLYALRFEAHGDLYEGRPHTAWARVMDAWRAIEASQLLRVQFGRIDARLLRARVAVASAAARWSGREPLLASAEQDAASLEREIRREAKAAAALVRAAVSVMRGQRAAAFDHLAGAIQGYETSEMHLLAACARHRQGELEGGETGRLKIEKAEAWMKAEGFERPAQWVRMYAPGFGQ